MAMAVRGAEERCRALDCTCSSTLENAIFSLTLLARYCFRLLSQQSCHGNSCVAVRGIVVLVLDLWARRRCGRHYFCHRDLGCHLMLSHVFASQSDFLCLRVGAKQERSWTSQSLESVSITVISPKVCHPHASFDEARAKIAAVRLAHDRLDRPLVFPACMRAEARSRVTPLACIDCFDYKVCAKSGVQKLGCRAYVRRLHLLCS